MDPMHDPLASDRTLGSTSTKDSAGESYDENAKTQESTYTKPKQVNRAPSSITGNGRLQTLFLLSLRRAFS